MHQATISGVADTIEGSGDSGDQGYGSWNSTVHPDGSDAESATFGYVADENGESDEEDDACSAAVKKPRFS